MEEKQKEKFEQAMFECVDEDMKGVVFNEELNQFSILKISSTYLNRIKKSVPDQFDFNYPDAEKYNVYTKSYLNDEEISEMWLIHGRDREDKIVKILKKIHGIKDPWDDDPDWFTTHKPGDEL